MIYSPWQTAPRSGSFRNHTKRIPCTLVGSAPAHPVFTSVFQQWRKFLSFREIWWKLIWLSTMFSFIIFGQSMKISKQLVTQISSRHGNLSICSRKCEFLEWKHRLTHFHLEQQQWLTQNQKLRCLVATEAHADTIRALFGQSGGELAVLWSEDVDSEIVD